MPVLSCVGFGLATVVLGFDRQGWITVFAGLLLALITLLTSYDHVDILGAASFELPQQAGIPCIAAAVATAIAEAQLASNDRRRRGVLRDRAEAATARERERAARADQLQARALRAGALVWLDPTPLHRRFRQLIATELAGGGS